MKILLGYFNAKVGREDIFKPTIGNESLHEILLLKLQCTHIVTFINSLGHSLMERRTTKLTIF
jgi:hypothetical protein